jgi:hypothetical protein
MSDRAPAMTRMGYLTLCESLGGNRVRLFFSDGLVVERALPVRTASRARIVDDGLGLRLRAGLELGVFELRRQGTRYRMETSAT